MKKKSEKKSVTSTASPTSKTSSPSGKGSPAKSALKKPPRKPTSASVDMTASGEEEDEEEEEEDEEEESEEEDDDDDYPEPSGYSFCMLLFFLFVGMLVGAAGVVLASKYLKLPECTCLCHCGPKKEENKTTQTPSNSTGFEEPTAEIETRAPVEVTTSSSSSVTVPKTTTAKPTTMAPTTTPVIREIVPSTTTAAPTTTLAPTNASVPTTTSAPTTTTTPTPSSETDREYTTPGTGAGIPTTTTTASPSTSNLIGNLRLPPRTRNDKLRTYNKRRIRYKKDVESSTKRPTIHKNGLRIFYQKTS